MKKTVAISLSALIVCLCLYGCEQNNVDDVAKNARTVYRASDSALLIAALTLEQKIGKEKTKEIILKVQTEIDTIVLPIIKDQNTLITKIVEDMLMLKLEFLDKDYKHLLKNAFDTLNEFYKSPTLNDSLTEEGVVYLHSFFNGLSNGCKVYLSEK